MRVLITGATGFAGRYLGQHLSETWAHAQLHGTTLNDHEQSPHCQLHQVDLTQADAVRALVQAVQPEIIFHLAAQASPRRSFDDPWNTLQNNIRSQLNLFEACHESKPRILVVSSADIYRTADEALDEDTPFSPTNPYAVSKITQDMLALQYHLSHSLPTLRARPFNHFGPGQTTGFVAPDFAMQVARIEAGHQEPLMKVGNLSPERDFTDVRDVVRAYRLITEKGQAGEVYNIASGNTYSIQFLLDTLLRFSSTKIDVEVDPARFVPVDVPIKRGDYSRLHRATGWQPQIPIEQTLRDLLDECRQRIHTQ